MEQEKFLRLFAEQFDDTDVSEITMDCKFRELDEWSSLIGLGVIAFIKTTYGKTVTAAELRICNTVKDLYDLVVKK